MTTLFCTKYFIGWIFQVLFCITEVGHIYQGSAFGVGSEQCMGYLVQDLLALHDAVVPNVSQYHLEHTILLTQIYCFHQLSLVISLYKSENSTYSLHLKFYCLLNI